jgi:hypothetical protein
MLRTDKKIIDVCCGSKMFWFDKNNQNVIFNDIRSEKHTLCDGRTLKIHPDTNMDFTDLCDIPSGSMKLVVFDPPHLKSLGQNSWMAKKYGVLDNNWKTLISKGFSECFRVLERDGVLIFKWNETDIRTSEILKLTDKNPLFGHLSGKRSNTHWVCFINS